MRERERERQMNMNIITTKKDLENVAKKKKRSYSNVFCRVNMI